MDFRVNPKGKVGWVELITGCMFAGKTEEFIRRIKRYQFSGENVLVFKPKIDDRYSKEDIFSHSGMKIEAIAISSTAEIKKIVVEHISENPELRIIGFDEVQFIDTDIVAYIEELANSGMIIVANGLDKNFKSEPFQNVDKLLVLAEYVDKLTSICKQCGGNANRTQRIVDGKPAKADEPIILVSANDHYEARCRHCYIRPQ